MKPEVWLGGPADMNTIVDAMAGAFVKQFPDKGLR